MAEVGETTSCQSERRWLEAVVVMVGRQAGTGRSERSNLEAKQSQGGNKLSPRHHPHQTLFSECTVLAVGASWLCGALNCHQHPGPDPDQSERIKLSI